MPARGPPVKLSHKEAFARSQQCVQRLETNPDDITRARENWRRLWAEDLGQVEMAVEQLEWLLGHARNFVRQSR